MSATTKEEGKEHPPNVGRNYAATIHIHYDFLGLMDMEELRRCMLEVECEGTWGESRKNWEWHPDVKNSTFYPLWGKTGRQLGGYTIETKCVIKHSQIHAFENFVNDFAKELVCHFPKLTFGAQASFRSVVVDENSETGDRRYSPGTALLDCDGFPAAIVAVSNGWPLVLLVPEETLRKFDRVAKRRKLTHIELANKLRDIVCRDCGQFHEKSVEIALDGMLRRE